MTGQIHAFDARVGGGYRMSLFYPPNERSSRGKTSDNEDRVQVRFVELVPERWIVEAVSFETIDPTLRDITILCKNLPPGLRAQDNETGSRLSLEQLACRFE